jgi:hypothetical protein
MNWKLFTSVLLSGIFGITLVSLAVWASWPDTTAMPASFALLILGTVMGWLFGIVISPYDSGEKSEFSEYGKLVSTAAGAFIAGKADTILSKMTDFDVLSIVRATGAMSAFVIAAIMVFYFRRYA